MVFLAFFIFLFSLVNVNFIHTNTILYNKFYTNFVTKELCLTNGLAGINKSLSSMEKFIYFIKKFKFSKNAVRNFNFILCYTIIMLILIICESSKQKSCLTFPFY